MNVLRIVVVLFVIVDEMLTIATAKEGRHANIGLIGSSSWRDLDGRFYSCFRALSGFHLEDKCLSGDRLKFTTNVDVAWLHNHEPQNCARHVWKQKAGKMARRSYTSY